MTAEENEGSFWDRGNILYVDNIGIYVAMSKHIELYIREG